MLLDELAAITGTTLVAVLDELGVCRSLRRSNLICALGTYRVLTEVSLVAPGRSTLAIDIDGRGVLVRRLCDATFAVIAVGAAADVYVAEVMLIEAAAGYALRASGCESAPAIGAAGTMTLPPLFDGTMTIPPPAGQNPSELPPVEASLVMRVGSLTNVYRDLERELDQTIEPDPDVDDARATIIAC